MIEMQIEALLTQYKQNTLGRLVRVFCQSNIVYV